MKKKKDLKHLKITGRIYKKHVVSYLFLTGKGEKDYSHYYVNKNKHFFGRVEIIDFDEIYEKIEILPKN